MLLLSNAKVVSFLNGDPMPRERSIRSLLIKYFSNRVCFTFPEFKDEVVVNLHLRNVELLLSLWIVADVALYR